MLCSSQSSPSPGDIYLWATLFFVACADGYNAVPPLVYHVKYSRTRDSMSLLNGLFLNVRLSFLHRRPYTTNLVFLGIHTSLSLEVGTPPVPFAPFLFHCFLWRVLLLVMCFAADKCLPIDAAALLLALLLLEI